MKSSKVKMIPEWVVLSCLSAVQIVNWELYREVSWKVEFVRGKFK